MSKIDKQAQTHVLVVKAAARSSSWSTHSAASFIYLRAYVKMYSIGGMGVAMGERETAMGAMGLNKGMDMR